VKSIPTGFFVLAIYNPATPTGIDNFILTMKLMKSMKKKNIIYLHGLFVLHGKFIIFAKPLKATLSLPPCRIAQISRCLTQMYRLRNHGLWLRILSHPPSPQSAPTGRLCHGSPTLLAASSING
jgi:hypothetical protein